MTTYSASRLQGITVFVQAVEAGSFTAAGQRIGLSKSAVGKGVATLEQRLGVRLLDRTTRRLALTAEGADFYQSCLRVLAELDEAESRAASRRREVSGTLRISLPVTFGRRWVMPVLRDLVRRHLKLALDVAFSDRAVDLLEETIDLAVRLGEPGNSASLSARYLGLQRTVTCGSPAYFAEHGAPTSIGELAGHDCITFGRSGDVFPWQLLDGEGRAVKVKIKGRHTISDGDALRAAVLDGLGIAQFPTWLVADELRSGTLQTVFAAQGVEGSSIHALWPATRDLAPKIRAVVDELMRAFMPVAPWDRDLA
ncbi:LysR family transcriptional regulator [Xanthomonas hyacinthi]|uniref:LysR family transcriptional regulator n=1 Tax=Xanthomonas hyacinthi TaxID=56455 RepID=A0A2S7ESI4_9XANT|nr:LysR family transcriptional regulator [Xanthomonas hyacinthi]KLD73508.1 LysR family transcriptional regulator [Xanthomonas hyacinthi DSM 19077]PPU96079.1 LysR family transcriptional regulator [Xanthomonas hyacinthi]QGY75443.1 LysR family transcriptional regulator [Xanthomonas hyacinthi]